MNRKFEVLTPQNSQLIFIEQQPQMAFGVQSIDRQVLKNNTVALANAAKVFDIPTTITTVETLPFSGHTYPELLGVFPGLPILERTSMNLWDDQKVRDSTEGKRQEKNCRGRRLDQGVQHHFRPACDERYRLRDLHGIGCLGRHLERST
jgi:nicotinamidase-related amidase